MFDTRQANKNRALRIAKSYIPEDKKDSYHREICKGCVHDTKLECLECCLCQDGNYYDTLKMKERRKYI